jgi:hypothetical protein
MLHEFAVDPGALSNWQSFRYLVEKFGVPHGRLISRFPRKWKGMVYDACHACREVERKKIEEELRNIYEKLVAAGREYNGGIPWLENAEVQHRARPFRAIISDSNPRNVPEVLLANDLRDNTPLWRVDREAIVPRSAVEMTREVRSLLQICTQVRFVDQYFDPTKYRYLNVLDHLLRATNGNSRISLIEYHVSDELGVPFFKGECQRRLPSLVPRGLKMTLILWRKERETAGETLHPRYILTDRGGIRIERGLDEGEDGETTDISLLDVALYSQRWSEYQRGAGVHEFVDEVTVSGERE